MFTGIIEGQGKVTALRGGPSGGRILEVQHPFPEVALGDSIAHDGVCLTAARIVSGQCFSVEAGPETLARTTVGQFEVGQSVNLERAVTLQTRLGGHLVQGHVDAVGTVREVKSRANAWDLWVDVPPDVLQLVIPRGSVTVDGISLTVTHRDGCGFALSIIPHTWEVTSLRQRNPGSKVNVEADLLARYVAGLMAPLGQDGLSWDKLATLGLTPE